MTSEWTSDLFKGSLVRLSSPADPQVMAECWSRWNRDMDYFRPLDSDPPRLYSAAKFKEWIEKDLGKDEPNEVFFTLRTLAEDRIIGFTALWDFAWNHSDCFVSIGIGEPEFRGRGYGTEAMQLTLRYAFTELNLRRVTLFVFEYNQRALRSYEKAGFVREGEIRDAMLRDGRRWKWIVMGILRQEWLKRQAA